MNFRKKFFLLWVFIAFIAAAFGLSKILELQKEPDVSVSESLPLCLPLDYDGDGQILLLDFAAFAKSYGKSCNPIGENKYESVSEFIIKNNPTDVNITQYRGFEINVDFSDYELLAVSPGTKSGWLSPIGTCDGNNAGIYSKDGAICFAVASFSDPFSSQETLGRVYLKDNISATISPSSVSLIYSDGEVLSEEIENVLIEPTSENSLDTRKFAVPIYANDKTMVSGNAVNLDLKFENANVLSFIPDSPSWTLTPLPCDTNNSNTMLVGGNGLCASFAKTGNLNGDELFGLVVIDPIDKKLPVTVSFGPNAGYSEGTSIFPITGTFRTYSTPESSTCGYVDIIGSGNKIFPLDQNVNLKDFAAFVELFKNPTTCKVQEIDKYQAFL
ncbi:hypothetical protein KC669_03915 [Candidatus Dojkabacteria bacterium]|uniref:Uncharacterized protein n=1 Tax=Candidatus Dojkabacteria bacterium TaxID=2099670 RepID=A0A955LBK1_9BACT|nr:hypothetical protein [Candidatus Dojkabacteria bacterium]